MKKKTPEILAPAGTAEALRAAILSGADAVYFGGKALNARRNADNFTREEIQRSVDFCHLYGAKAYLTLNTLMFDKEIPQVLDEIAYACSIGFDAIIVQDLGVVRLLTQCAPQMPLFASTQMSVHNLSDVNALKALGFTRVVLARELSKRELAHILQNSDIETEVFVHGALCYALSGQCYFSAFLGERSGNRGLCAQVCRLPFGAEDASRHNLSLKDLSLIDYVNELSDLGVTSFKIEGRMKGSQYVSTAVSAFKNALSGDFYEKDVLENIFSRTGFTDGYYRAQVDGKMFGVRRPEDKDRSLAARQNVAVSAKTIPIKMHYDISSTSCILTVRDDMQHEKTVTAAPAVPAVNKPTNKETVERSLFKTNDTPYCIESLQGTLEEGLFLPVSKINDLRRTALAALTKERTAISACSFSPPVLSSYKRPKRTPALTASFQHEGQLAPEMLSDLTYASFDVFTLLRMEPSFLSAHRDKLVAELPRVYFSDEATLVAALKQLQEYGLYMAKCHSLGRMRLAQEAGFRVIGGFGFNLANSQAFEFMAQYHPLYLTLSVEMSRRDIQTLTFAGETSAIAYGHFPLMISRSCPIKPETGCVRCSKQLIDRKGVAFPVLCHPQSIEILNAVPLYLADKPDWLSTTHYLELYFTIESAQDCYDIIRAYRENRPNEKPFTRGIYGRGVL